GARIPRTEAYFWYAAGTRGEGQHSIWAFYEAVIFERTAKTIIPTLLRNSHGNQYTTPVPLKQ
ncbi:MAG TPA: hypothetical protein PKY58_13035, partial [Syntrophales bacterium]|nr:hypothetical protein [Syntrophales bacterium]